MGRLLLSATAWAYWSVHRRIRRQGEAVVGGQGVGILGLPEIPAEIRVGRIGGVARTSPAVFFNQARIESGLRQLVHGVEAVFRLKIFNITAVAPDRN